MLARGGETYLQHVVAIEHARLEPEFLHKSWHCGRWEENPRVAIDV